MATSGGQQRPHHQRLIGIVAGVLVVVIGLVSASVVLLAGGDDDTSAPESPPKTAEPTGPPAKVEFRPVLQTLPKTSDCSKPDVWCTPSHAEAYRLAPAALRTPDIVEAAARFSGYGEWVVGIALSNEGASRFEAVTGRLAGNSGVRAQLAVVVDGDVISAPVVQAPVPGGFTDISANFTRAEAERLAAAIDP
jgi:preprotein translocase subunit SecD